MAHIQSPGCTEDGEDHQPQGIQRHKQLAEVAHQRCRDNSRHGSACHQQHILRMLNPEQGIVAQKHIADGAPPDGRRRRDDHYAKQIHPPPTRCQRAGHPFGHQAEQEESM